VRYLLGLVNCVVCLIKMARYRRHGGEESDSDEEMVAPAAAPAPAPAAVTEQMAGRRRRSRHTLPKGKTFKAKTLKRVLRKAGLKTTGKKSTLRARARKAHLIRGGGIADTAATV